MRFFRARATEYQLAGVEAELERQGFIPLPTLPPGPLRRAAMLLEVAGLNRPLLKAAGTPVLAPGGNLPHGEFFPWQLRRPFIPWRYDCWEPEYPIWERFFRQSRVPAVLLTSRDAVSHFAARLPGLPVLWMPESISPMDFPTGPGLVERPLDVLELGRRYDAFHQRVGPLLAAAGRRHLYEQQKGQVVFDGLSALAHGLASAKVSVCFPGSVTHPARSGRTCTVTGRYFQSIAAGALVVGVCPPELKDLFGYNPVLELKDPGSLLEVLEGIERYQPLVDRNLARFHEVGTTAVRVAEVKTALGHLGYPVPQSPPA